MKRLAITCTVAISIGFTGPLRAAVEPSGGPESQLDSSVGQPVYDLDDHYVGRVTTTTEANGELSAIVAPGPIFAARGQLFLPGGDMTPRADGGWLVALSDASVGDLSPYRPGNPVPLYSY